jgi:hypothetical protein
MLIDTTPRSRVDPFLVNGSIRVDIPLSFRIYIVPIFSQSCSSLVPKLGLGDCRGLFRSPISTTPSPLPRATNAKEKSEKAAKNEMLMEINRKGEDARMKAARMEILNVKRKEWEVQSICNSIMNGLIDSL